MDNSFLAQLGKLTEDEIEFVKQFRTASEKQKAGIIKAIDAQLKEFEYKYKTAPTD